MVKYEYDAWGNHAVLDSEGYDIEDPKHIGNVNPFRYRGYYYDTETGLYYLQTRYYDPETGRFISQDSIEYAAPETINGLNLYAYCRNNPVMAVDPNGQVAFGLLASLAIALSSVIVGGVSQLLSNALAGETGSDLWRGVAGAAFGAGVNALFLCLTVASGGAALIFAATAGALTQTAINALETAIRGEEVTWSLTAQDLALNYLSTLAGNAIGSLIVPTNHNWFAPQKFLSVFLKPYGQKVLMQNAIGSFLSGVINFFKLYIAGYNKIKSSPKIPENNFIWNK